MDRLDLVIGIEKLRAEEYNQPYVDLTFVCRCDTAINDVKSTKDYADALSVLDFFHQRVLNRLKLTERA